MSKKLAKILRTEMSASLPAIAKLLESKGRNRDKILAHINEEEAELLRMHGGSGTINPETGLMEFDDGFQSYDYSSVGAVPGQEGVSYTPQEAMNYQPPAQAYTPTPAGEFINRYQTPLQQSDIGGSYGGDLYQPLKYDINRANLPQTNFGVGARPESPSLATPYGAQPQLSASAPSVPGQEPGIADRLASALGVNKDTLAKLGIGGAQGLMGLITANRAAAQGQEAKKELGAMAAPYRKRGQELLTAAERGELNPVGQQQLQAMQARLAQGVEQRGGVGVQQAQAQINAYRDQLIQAQYDLGLKVLGIADNISAGAIKTGLQADQYVNELTQNYMTNVARTLYGVAPQQAQSQLGV
jgi:hypothetical protein